MAAHLWITPDVSQEADGCGPGEVAWKNDEDFSVTFYSCRHTFKHICAVEVLYGFTVWKQTQIVFS